MDMSKYKPSEDEVQMAWIVHHATTGECAQALVEFVRFAKKLQGSESEPPPIVARLLSILWQELVLSIEDSRCPNSVDDIEEEILLQCQTRRPKLELDICISELRGLIGTDQDIAQQLAERYLRELESHRVRVLAVGARKERFAPEMLMAISTSLNEAGVTPMTYH